MLFNYFDKNFLVAIQSLDNLWRVNKGNRFAASSLGHKGEMWVLGTYNINIYLFITNITITGNNSNAVARSALTYRENICVMFCEKLLDFHIISCEFSKKF